MKKLILATILILSNQIPAIGQVVDLRLKAKTARENFNFTLAQEYDRQADLLIEKERERLAASQYRGSLDPSSVNFKPLVVDPTPVSRGFSQPLVPQTTPTTTSVSPPPNYGSYIPTSQPYVPPSSNRTPSATEVMNRYH